MSKTLLEAPTDFNHGKLEKWFTVQEKLAELKAEETKLRKELFDSAFPNPVEGSANKMKLGDGFILQAEHKLNRSIDEGSLESITAQLQEAGVVIEDIVARKPTLIKSGWNKLSEAQNKMFEECLITKPGTPSLKVVKPKKAVK